MILQGISEDILLWDDVIDLGYWPTQVLNARFKPGVKFMLADPANNGIVKILHIDIHGRLTLEVDVYDEFTQIIYWHFNNGVTHREDGPARKTETQEWYYFRGKSYGHSKKIAAIWPQKVKELKMLEVLDR